LRQIRSKGKKPQKQMFAIDTLYPLSPAQIAAIKELFFLLAIDLR
jgi:hypothetical protein